MCAQAYIADEADCSDKSDDGFSSGPDDNFMSTQEESTCQRAPITLGDGQILFEGEERWTKDVVQAILESCGEGDRLTDVCKSALARFETGPNTFKPRYVVPSSGYRRIKPVGGLPGLNMGTIPKRFRHSLMPEGVSKIIEIDAKKCGPTSMINLATMLQLDHVYLSKLVDNELNIEKSHALSAINRDSIGVSEPDEVKEIHCEVTEVFRLVKDVYSDALSDCCNERNPQGSKVAVICSRMEAIVVACVVRFVKELLHHHAKLLGCVGDAVFIGVFEQLPWPAHQLEKIISDYVSESTQGFDWTWLFTEAPCTGTSHSLSYEFHVTELEPPQPESTNDLDSELGDGPSQSDETASPPASSEYFVSGTGENISSTTSPEDDVQLIPGLIKFCQQKSHDVRDYQPLAQYYFTYASLNGIVFPPEGKAKRVSKDEATAILLETIRILNVFVSGFRGNGGVVMFNPDRRDNQVYVPVDIDTDDDTVCNRMIDPVGQKKEFIVWMCRELIPWPSLMQCFKINAHTVPLSQLLACAFGCSGRFSPASYETLPRTKLSSHLVLAFPQGALHFGATPPGKAKLVKWADETEAYHVRTFMNVGQPVFNDLIEFYTDGDMDLVKMASDLGPELLKNLYPLIALIVLNQDPDKVVFGPDEIPNLASTDEGCDILRAVQYLLTLMGFALGVVAQFPVFVYIYGYAGAGKSILMNSILKFIGSDFVHYINAADDSKHAMNIAVDTADGMTLATTLFNNDLQRPFKQAVAEKLLDMIDVTSTGPIYVEPKGRESYGMARPTDRNIIAIGAGNLSPEKLVNGTIPAWTRRVLACPLITPIKGKITVDLEESLSEHRDMIMLLSALFAKNHTETSPFEKPSPPKLIQEFTTLWDDDLGNDELMTAIDSAYGKLIINDDLKSPSCISYNKIVIGVKMRDFAQLVKKTMTNPPSISAIRSACEKRLSNMYSHDLCKAAMVCRQCHRVFPRMSDITKCRRILHDRYVRSEEFASCLKPKEFAHCDPIQVRAIICGAMLRESINEDQ